MKKTVTGSGESKPPAAGEKQYHRKPCRRCGDGSSRLPKNQKLCSCILSAPCKRCGEIDREQYGHCRPCHRNRSTNETAARAAAQRRSDPVRIASRRRSNFKHLSDDELMFLFSLKECSWCGLAGSRMVIEHSHDCPMHANTKTGCKFCVRGVAHHGCNQHIAILDRLYNELSREQRVPSANNAVWNWYLVYRDEMPLLRVGTPYSHSFSELQAIAAGIYDIYTQSNARDSH